MKALSVVLRIRHALDCSAAYLYRFARSNVFTPFLNSVLSIVLLTRLTGLYTGPDSYLIYFVGPLGGNTSLVNMENIFRRAPARTLNGVPVKFEEIDDAGDPALARSIAKSLTSKPETLMVVGHVLSSTTKEALPVYMNAHPQVPVILTTETNPQILPASADPDQEFPVFRLSPTDDDQAQSAYEFAKDHGARRFWVVDDPANAVYTKYLAYKFLEDAQRDTTKVLLSTSVMNLPNTDVLERLDVQWVFFAGEWRGALTLIRSLKALSPLHMNFILSDAAASPELLANGGSDVDGVYVMHQLKAKNFRKGDQGYGIYANYSLEIIDRLLKKADQRFSTLARDTVGFPYMLRRTLRIHRVSDARRVLIKCMNRSMSTPFRMSTGEVFRFRKDGTREGAKFNVWKIQNHKFVDMDEVTGPRSSQKLLARNGSANETRRVSKVAMR